MILKLDMNSTVPIYVQLRNQIVMGIGHGELKEGERLPTVRQLASDAGVVETLYMWRKVLLGFRKNIL